MVTLSTKEERLLEGVDQGISTTYKDEDSAEKLELLCWDIKMVFGMFWDEKGETIITLEQTDISPESK